MRERCPRIAEFGRLVTTAIGLTVVATMLVVASGCSSSNSVKPAPTIAPDATSFPVGITAFAVTDTTRSVPATPSQPGAPERFLQVRVWYPGVAPSLADAVDDNFNSIPSPTPMFDENPATASGPFPLIVLAHDLGSTPALYGDLAANWAGAGFVVAAPSFPLSDSYAPGGPDGSDSINQPGDVRAVIDRILELSDANDGGILAGMIDSSSIGIVGDGAGAGTAATMFTNPCCLNERIDAFIVMSLGTNEYMGVAVEWPQNRPLLVVSGDARVASPETISDDIFAEARAPKGLLTLRGADRNSYIVRSSRAFAVTAATTTDFWRIYLDGASGEVGANSGDYVPDVATLMFIPE